MNTENWNGNYNAKFSDLVGKAISKIDGLEVGSDTVRLSTSCGLVYQMHYYPD